MDITQMLNMPKIALVGTFDQLLVDGMEALEMKYDLCESEKDCRQDFDIVIIAEDNLDRALEIVKKMDAVPILQRAKTEFINFDAIKETGNAFTFDKNTPWHILEAVIKAQETYRFKYDWKTVSKACELFVSGR